jgi:N6-L-threonylcarbamoyladenine synthase
MVILGIETSCDDTGIGIVANGPMGDRRILGNAIASQLAAHKPYGGVVPEIAARAHLDVIGAVIDDALRQSGLTLDKIDGIAATTGPGLIGGVMVGAMLGKGIAAVRHLPFIAVNHLEAHALTARLTDDVRFPYLLLLASGGHCQLIAALGVGDYRILGRTIDDAIGECFDKCAKMLGLGYPGGPLIEQAARGGNPNAFALPRPMLGRAGCDFSFSGLKTAVRTLLEGREKTPQLVADMAASLQSTIAASVADRSRHAFTMLRDMGITPTCFVAAGGVAANHALRQKLTEIAAEQGVGFAAPPPKLCTDNGVMVAWAGLERLRLGLQNGLDTPARPRWPLDELKQAL